MIAQLLQAVTAFVGGVVSFISPCVLPLVPAYIGYLGSQGLTISDEPSMERKWHTLRHGFAFVLGFTVIFLTLGFTASALGTLLYDLRFYLARIGGVIVILFGLHMLGILRIPLLSYEWRAGDMERWEGRGYITSFFMGIFFSAGWSPCVGPVLGTILTLTLQEGTISWGMALLAIYSLGLAVPFLAAAWSLDWVLTLLHKYGKVSHWAEKFMGAVLVLMGILLVTGRLARLASVQTWSDLWRVLW